jgi:uncharacterized damage-inducible protein DinB
MPNRSLQELLRGRGAHVDPVACVAGLEADMAGRQLPGVEHTIWALVWHMNYWMDYELQSMDGREPSYPLHASESWPTTAAPPTATAWQEEEARFRRLIEQLLEWARRAAVDGHGARLVHRDKGESLQTVLWQMAAHNSYHTGQVALLRRAFGLWPPPGGGDTW